MLVAKKYTKNLKIAVCLFIAIAAIFLLGNFVLAGTSADLGLNYAAGTGLSNTQDIRITIAKIIRIALGFLGIIALSLIIYAGYLWMTSGGNPEKIEQAKKILQNAVVGLIIILSAFAIASFILNMLTGGSGGGQNGPGNGPPTNYGLSALGNGIIESHYPARGQREVPRNTSIIITFREPMLASTLCTNPGNPGDQEVPNTQKICKGIDIPQGNITGNTNSNVVGIFKKIDEAKCIDVRNNTPLFSGCPSWTYAKVYSSIGNKIFVIVPINYLGSPSEYIDYTVYLGKGLLRQTGELAFPNGFEKDYGWSFEVSNKIDLTPPQVQKNGVFPSPDGLEGSDDKKDIRVSGGGQRAVGSITVNSPSIYSDASVLSVKKPVDAIYGDASVTVDKNCDQNGPLKINVDTVNKSIVKLTGSGDKLLGQGNVVGKTVSFPQVCNLKLTLLSGDFAVGNMWVATVAAMTAADTITLDNTTYTASDIVGGNNFKVESDNGATASNIFKTLYYLGESSLGGGFITIETKADSNPATLTIRAKAVGTAGNNINLSSSNPATLTISPMIGGKDQAETVTPNGRTDQPMNSAIQINFNEAIMPLTVSGVSNDVKEFIRVVNIGGSKRSNATCAENYECSSYKCEGLVGNKKCAGNNGPKPSGELCQADGECLSYKCDGTPTKVCVANELQGKFTVSNQYSTVEFLSDKECGFNACGEKIYCLPTDSHLKIELNAANLISCANNQNNADDSLCVDKSPFNTCDVSRKFCRDNVNVNSYYPQADKTKNIIDGITDAAFNSLDGNRNGTAYGPASYYNENLPENTDAEKLVKAALGDSFKWSFFISNVLDLTPPKIKTTTPVISGTSIPLDAAVTISFDKLMLSSRLSTGSLTIQNGKAFITHYLLNLRSSVDQPLGYWVTNLGQLNGAGEIISTDAYINHTSFSTVTTYTAQAGSGLKDIYQNCFLPCAGPACSGDSKVGNQKPCCCNGTAATSCP